MFKKYYIILCFFAFVSDASAQDSVFDTIGHRINNDLQYGIKDLIIAKRVENNLLKLASDGSWIDIDYKDAKHDPLNRIKEMVIAYVRPTNQFYNSEKIYFLLVNALQHWANQNPKNKNWWYNDIFYPQTLGQILILLQQNNKMLPSNLQAVLVGRMQRKMRVNDGANTSDIALHYLYRACLTKNKATLDSAATFLYQPIVVNNDKEGIQIDGSYHQHGKQQAIASYGRVFISNAINAAYYLRNTPYALPKQQMQILVDFLKNTFLKTLRGPFYDFNVRGRGISRKDSLISGITSLITKISFFDPQNKPYWNASALRNAKKSAPSYGIVPVNNYYWKSSYALHVQPTYTFSVQAVSNRTLRTERGNNENILGKFLADGATNIQRTGSEYANLMPIWEWDKIPGTTSRDYPDDGGAVVKKDWGIPGTTNFVGGVSDGRYGVAAYHLNHDSVSAKKAWFFFDKEIVCLGAGITSNVAEPIVTTINQAWLKGKILTMSPNQTNVLAKNTHKIYNNTTAVMHDQIGYFFPSAQKIAIANQTQKGSWYRINNFQSKEEIEGKVFKMWIDHGQKPTNAGYQYIVSPGISTISQNKYSFQAIQVLKNTPEIQAVEHNELAIIQIVFYQPGTLDMPHFFIKVDQPCIIHIKNYNTNHANLFISDPTQQNSEINVTLKLPKYLNQKIITYALPSSEMAGKTLNYPIN